MKGSPAGRIVGWLHGQPDAYYVGCTVTHEDKSTDEFIAEAPELQAAGREVERVLAGEGWTLAVALKVDTRDADGVDIGMHARFGPRIGR